MKYESKLFRKKVFFDLIRCVSNRLDDGGGGHRRRLRAIRHQLDQRDGRRSKRRGGFGSGGEADESEHAIYEKRRHERRGKLHFCQTGFDSHGEEDAFLVLQ